MRLVPIIGIFLLGTATAASAQAIDVNNALGPSGTHFNIELPADSHTYECWTATNNSYRHTFKVYQNGVLKHSEQFDVIFPTSPTYFQRIVSFSGWNLQVGDVIHFHSKCIIIGSKIFDQDSLYGDCVDLIGRAPAGPGLERRGAAPSAVDEKRRFETLFA